MAGETPANNGGTGNDGGQQQQQSNGGQQQQQQPGGEQPWHQGVDAGLAGYLQNRGWDKLSPKDAALAAAKAHHEAEKLIGAPPDQVVRIPKDANDKDGWGKVYARLGVPADAKEYDFSGVKFTSGEALDGEFTTALQSFSGEQHFTKDQASAVARFLTKQIEQADASEAAEYTAKLMAEKASLKTNWGANHNANTVVAQNAAEKLGVKAEEIAALEKTIGYARVMEMFRNVGSRIGEDKFIRDGGASGGSQVMTKEGAQSRLDMLQTDVEWLERFNKGGARERQEFDNLTRLVAGV